MTPLAGYLSSGCCNRAPQPGCFKQQKWISHSLGSPDQGACGFRVWWGTASWLVDGGCLLCIRSAFPPRLPMRAERETERQRQRDREGGSSFSYKGTSAFTRVRLSGPHLSPVPSQRLHLQMPSVEGWGCSVDLEGTQTSSP